MSRMGSLRQLSVWIAVLACQVGLAETLNLDGTPADTAQARGETEYFSEIFGTEVVTNVSQPTLTVFLPDPDKATGQAVVIAPGGGYHALSINSEGHDVARWLTQHGIAAFVLRYRLVPGGADVVAELRAKPAALAARDMAAVAPKSGADGLAAMRLVKAQAARFNIDPAQVGFMGFSAGGGVTLHVAHHYDAQSRPAFVAPIYAAVRWLGETPLPADAPPAFVLAATDDQLGLAADSIALYERWRAAGKAVELHMYARGGHGFDMRPGGSPSDQWIERFYDWLMDSKPGGSASAVAE